ncbi:MAG: hypothetical protein HOI95_04910 [Chromatiales bacterium]|jgi:hypothetical protein|nr:hypothetical protein [Chromatiales bacterium]
MKPIVELYLTVAVCAFGATYFAWEAWTSVGDRQLTYLSFLIVGFIFAHRAVKDVLGQMRAEKEEAAQATAGSDKVEGSGSKDEK